MPRPPDWFGGQRFPKPGRRVAKLKRMTPCPPPTAAPLLPPPQPPQPPQAPLARLTHLLYLHGFRSSPQSMKAKRLAQWVAQHRPDVCFWCPQLPPSPREAIALVLAGTADWPAASSAVMGSSLGGFYAWVVAEQRGWPALAINPVVHAARDLARHIGEHSHWQNPQDRFFFRPEFIEELRAMAPAALTRPERYAALIATGDEVLDWREMWALHAQSQARIIAGSDHALSDFEAHLPFVLQFLSLTSSATFIS